MRQLTLSLSLAAGLLAGCSEQPPAPEADAATPPASPAAAESEVTGETDGMVAVAESMIDAFYSFDPTRLEPLLAEAGEAREKILYYQGWAEGGNYKVLKRPGCVVESPTVVRCPITVEDDPVMALGSDFKVTDTFTLTFEGTTIVNVETSSDDQPIYYQARKWVEKNKPEIMDGPCKDRGAGGKTPGDCARAMTAAYAEFAASDDFPGLGG